MKIIMVLNSDFGQIGNIGLRSLPIAKTIKENKDELTIFCRDYKKSLKKKYNPIKIIPFGNMIMKFFTAIPIFIYKKFPAEKVKMHIFEWFMIRRLKKIDLESVEIIHSWDYLPKTFNYVKKKNKNIIIIKDMTMSFLNVLKPLKKDYFGNMNLELSKEIKESIPNIDYFIAPSKTTKNSIMNEGISESKILRVNHGVDIKKFKPKTSKEDPKFRVAFAGNINKRKGIYYLIKAWKELNLNNAELNLYGRVYSEIKLYLNDAEKYNINTPGFVDLEKYLPLNDILVHPSLLESTPKILNEAHASGLPIITTNNSGPNFTDGVEGFIIPEQNIEELKEKIKFFYDNPDKVEEFGKRSRNFIGNYSWEEYGENVYNNYLKIVKKNKD